MHPTQFCPEDKSKCTRANVFNFIHWQSTLGGSAVIKNNNSTLPIFRVIHLYQIYILKKFCPEYNSKSTWEIYKLKIGMYSNNSFVTQWERNILTNINNRSLFRLLFTLKTCFQGSHVHLESLSASVANITRSRSKDNDYLKLISDVPWLSNW